MEAKHKHTPGPLVVNYPRNTEVMADDVRIVMCCAPTDDVSCLDEAESNASLIAAAPELLEAVKTLVKLHHDWFRGSAYVTVDFEKKNNAAIEAARDAIAKATGN